MFIEKKDWDLIILTVRNASQMHIAKQLLSGCASRFAQSVLVISDSENGKSIGSGGAVLRALRFLSDRSQKVLIINSGGMSKRAVPYAVQGKVFADVEYKGQCMTLLELILMQCSFIASQIKSGVLISCSDICVILQNICISSNENICFCVQSNIETGMRHGVMFGDKNRKLMNYLHKKSAEQLYSLGATNEIAIDTGLLFLHDNTIQALKKALEDNVLCQMLQNADCEISLYEDILFLFSKNKDKKRYLNDSVSLNHLEIRKKLWETLCDFSIRICMVEASEFWHFGTLDESRRNIIKLSQKKTVFINSVIESNCRVGDETVLDNVRLQNCIVGNNCMLSDISLCDSVIEKDQSVCGIRLREGEFITVVCPITENPKQIVNGEELWNIPRFYKGKSFCESYKKWLSRSKESTFSLAYCIENADPSYRLDWAQYLRDMAFPCNDATYDLYREKILGSYFKKNIPLSHMRFVQASVRVRLPVRVNLSGTWTDAMPYCVDNGGDVINAAVSIGNTLPVCVEAQMLPEPILLLEDEEARIRYSAEEWNGTLQMTEIGRFNLHLVALNIFGITSKTRITNGLRLSTRVDGLASGSGLGISSILLSGCFLALNRLFNAKLSCDEILHMVFVAEQKMKVGGGWQDQVGGLIPGIKRTSSRPGLRQDLSIQKLPILPQIQSLFSGRMCLLHSGKRHFGRFIVQDVMHQYLSGDIQTISGLNELKKMNCEMEESIINDDSERFLVCLNHHGEVLKTLSSLIVDEEMERIIKKSEPICCATSICGAGGGGYFLACLKSGKTMDDLRSVMCNSFPHLSQDCVQPIRLFDSTEYFFEEA